MMTTWTRILIFNCLLSIPFTLANASSCEDIVNRMSRDINKYTGSLQQHHFSWMNVSWLQRQLGEGHEKKITDNQIQYEWRCGEESDTFLLVETNQAKAIRDIQGEYSSSEGSGLFSAHFDPPLQPVMPVKKTPDTKPVVQNKIILPAPAPVNDKPVTLAQNIQAYNRRFNTTIQNADQLQEDIVAKLKNYAANLRQCKPGIYRYTVPGFPSLLFFTSLIQGYQNNHCVVDTAYQLLGNNMLIKCQYQPQSLMMFTDIYAEILSKIGDTAEKRAQAENEKVVVNDCQVLVKGRKA
ncbi:MAG: hypothetical protein EPO11_10165 [Gammaproteobacteria bacterium]|nr:MAG: hypothetical protein EPO11_10165 [Gammaproteobacteria bacterium]